MTKRMLIDSTNAEETRVVVLEGNRLEDYDIESSTKHQLKGNIYLAKVIRVEPSLQAAFVEYGGNRHGFLAFGEIHPDYYQIPVADRKRLIEAQEQEAREEEERADREAAHFPSRRNDFQSEHEDHESGEPDSGELDSGEADSGDPDSGDQDPGDPDGGEHAEAESFEPEPAAHEASVEPADLAPEALPYEAQVVEAEPILEAFEVPAEQAAALFPPDRDPEGADMAPEEVEPGPAAARAIAADQIVAEEIAEQAEAESDDGEAHTGGDAPAPEQIGGEHDTEEHQARRTMPRFLRNYKIQEVIRRRQILLVQVVKEERGSKGAALTTYISLAGRFCVLMPNSPRGGGISRKITSASDRRRLKEVTTELDLPRGMGLIVRTAGAARPKAEILRDCEYLLDQWNRIRELTMKSVAPALIYEEASLIKRAIRDVYSRDVDDILVDGEQGWRAAREFMRMLMPTHARKVHLWKEPQPLFAKAQVEAQLETILSPTVQLRSGGYLVINQTEALVAIDVNSGRSTRERGIEETALRTNCEAADEIARQLRLRDLAGLIVIDFIDMEHRRNVATVERRLKEALKQDRARIQVGNISHFGLMEMSRQRLRPSLTETNFVICSHCGGTGHVRSTESAALVVLRAIEEEGGKRKAAEIVVHCHSSVALYVLNHKRARLADIEARHAMTVLFVSDDLLMPPALRIERVRAQAPSEAPPPVQQLAPPEPFVDPDELDVEDADDEEDEVAEAAPTSETEEEREQRRGRRRRRRRGRRDEASTPEAESAEAADGAQAAASDELEPEANGAEDGEGESEPGEAGESAEGDRRRRSRRGGRRRRRGRAEGEATETTPELDEDETAPVPAHVQAPAPRPAYVGPTPADPFAGTYDIYAVMDEPDEPVRPAATITAIPIAAPESTSTPTPAPTSAPASEPNAEPEASAEPEPQPEQVQPQAPAPEPEPVAALPAEPEPEPVAGPAIQPVVISTEAPPAERKRGWWRR